MSIKLPATLQGKITMSLIAGLLIVGTALVMDVTGFAGGDETITMVFLVFFGAILVLQVIPGLILIGSMIRGLIVLRKREDAE